MKIGLIHNLYGTYSRGGAETVVAMMAADYKAQGHEVFIITTKPWNAPTLEKTDAAGNRIYYLNSHYYNLGRKTKLFRALWQAANVFSFNKARKIKSLLAAEHPDLVVTHNLIGLGWLTPGVIRRQKIRHEHFLHDIQLLHPSGLMFWGQENLINAPAAQAYQALTRSLIASPQKVISPSRWLLELHHHHGFFSDSETEIKPFNWPLDKKANDHLNSPELSSSEPASKPKKESFRFLFIGQIEEQKGVFLLIEAFKKISDQNIKLTFAVRGGGQSLNEAKRRAAGDQRIEFLGPLSFDETEKIKTASDCLVVPSLCYENSPTVIYGAHAAGLPVIAAAIGGIPEIITSGDSLFIPGNAADLSLKMTEIMTRIPGASYSL